MNTKSLTFVRTATNWTIALVLVAVLLLSVANPAYAAPKARVKSVTVSSQSGTLTYGTSSSVSYNVVVTPQVAGVATVNLSISGLPAGADGSFNPGTLTFSGASGKTSVLTITSDPANPAGASSFTVSAIGQNTKTALGTLTIGKRTASVTASNLPKVYGSTLSFAGSEFSTSNFINGDQVTSVTLASSGAAAGATVAGSPYQIVPSAAIGTGLGNYNINYQSGSLTVTPKPLDVTGVVGVNKTYDGNTTASVDASVAVLSGVIAPDVVTLNTGAAAGIFASAEVGSQSISVTGLTLGGTDAGNYSVVQPVATGNINPATATIKANNAFKPAGPIDPAFGFTASNFVNGEDASVITTQPTCGVAVAHDTVGEYDISCSGAAAHNYTFSYAIGTLTVNSVNIPPSDITLSHSSVAENQNAGLLVGNLTTTDADSSLGETYSYSLVSTGSCAGPDNGSFQVDSTIHSSGPVALLTAAKFHYVTKSSYTICVETNDGFSGTFDKQFIISVLPSSITFASNGLNDGWVLESGEFTNVGGSKNNTNTTLLVGDDKANKQYRSILSFATGLLPDNATIYQVTIKVRKQGLVGAANIFSQLQGLRVDINKPSFGASSLAFGDFQAAPTATSGKLLVGKFGPATDANGWYTANLGPSAIPFLNKVGQTQFRLRFFKDDNNNLKADYLSLYSGNAVLAYRPQLIVLYSVP